MIRYDDGLSFMLRFENIAWYEDGKVRILDRRVYPTTIRYEECFTYQEVAKAITDMVTQSAGPYTAAAMGMVLAVYECRDMKEAEQIAFLEKAADTISHARPTTTKRMLNVTKECLDTAKEAMKNGKNVVDEVFERAVFMTNRRYKKVYQIAENFVEFFPNKGNIMTYCFAETIVGQMLKVANSRGKDIGVFVNETRPYFQGGRLTATVASQMGNKTTVITDGMPAFVFSNENIDLFTTAADAICLDGHIVNKVGTFNTAIVAKRFGVPYYVTGAPDYGHPKVDSVKIEMRDPEFTLQAMGVRVGADTVHGYYPAFDITPPDLVERVITDRGVFLPNKLAEYFEKGGVDETDLVL